MQLLICLGLEDKYPHSAGGGGVILFAHLTLEKSLASAGGIDCAVAGD
jgi:hypothetical protein